jgi:hypothetical protein
MPATMTDPHRQFRWQKRAAGASLLLLAAVVWLAPVRAQSPSPPPLGESPDPAGSVVTPAASQMSGPDPTPPPGGVVPLPAGIVGGSCDDPAVDDRIALQGPVAGGSEDDRPERLVYASLSQISGSLEDLVADGRVLTVGGNAEAPESAVACGSLDAPRQGPTDLAIALEPLHESGYAGTALFHEASGTVTVTIVVVAPAQDAAESEGSPGPGGSASPSTPTPQPSNPPSVGPRPSVLPGTSGAPPFSPLPQAAPPGG